MDDVICSDCGAQVEYYEFISGGHRCPWYLKPDTDNETFTQYQERLAAAKAAYLAK
jgi:hypothetical protein